MPRKVCRATIALVFVRILDIEFPHGSGALRRGCLRLSAIGRRSDLCGIVLIWAAPSVGCTAVMGA